MRIRCCNLPKLLTQLARVRTSWLIRYGVLPLLVLVANDANADSLPFPCTGCALHVGMGATYHFWSSTGGTVIPITVTTAGDRYEFGVFRMANEQSFYDGREHLQRVTAKPYWGASASRRWTLIRRSPWNLYFGFGLSYKTESDQLSVTHWNFASQLGARVRLHDGGPELEVTVRHWSNAGIRLPNRGQDFFTVSYSFAP